MNQQFRLTTLGSIFVAVYLLMGFTSGGPIINPGFVAFPTIPNTGIYRSAGGGNLCWVANPEFVTDAVVNYSGHDFDQFATYLRSLDPCIEEIGEGFFASKSHELPGIYYSNGSGSYCWIGNPAQVTGPVHTYESNISLYTSAELDGQCASTKPYNVEGDSCTLPESLRAKSCTSTDRTWGYCDENTQLAYSDPLFSMRKPSSDRICGLVSYRSIPEPKTPTGRCQNSMLDYCLAQSGKGEGASQDIPNGAWYYQTGTTKQFPKIRCQCGCFVAGTEIETGSGARAIDSLLADAESGLPVEVVHLDEPGFEYESSKVKAVDFTVGPETNPLIRLKTDSGLQLTVTRLHPVLVQRTDGMEMVQASDLSIGDLLQASAGAKTSIIEIKNIKYEANPLVYNLNTQLVGAHAHIIVADGLQVGDLAWQMKLSEDNARAETLVNSTAISK